MGRRVAAGALALVVLAAAFVASPSLRASLRDLLLPDPSILVDPPVVTPSEVAARTSFTVLWPTYLPASVGYQSGGVGPAGSHGPGTGIEKGSFASFTWVDSGRIGATPFIHLVEVNGAFPLPNGQPIQIRGQAGVVTTAISQNPAGRAGDSDVTIVWRENGLTLSVVGSAIPETDVQHVAASLRPLNRPTTIPFLDKVAWRKNDKRAIVGIPDDFPLPSVTHFADLKVYLIHNEAGFLALIDNDPHLHHPTAWNVAAQTFISPAHGEMYDWSGNCIGGPCPRGLDRYPVRVEAGEVVVELDQRLSGRPVGDHWRITPSPRPPFVPWGRV